MTPRQLQAFIAVAETLSFARAGERLHMSQPALSLAIQKLEQSLGGALLNRTTRQVRLTPEGVALLPQALHVLADWENVRERAKQRFSLQRGHVTIAAMPSFAGSILPRALRRFRERFPNIGVSVHDVVNEQVIDMVANGRVELGFAFEPEGARGLSFESLFLDRFIAIVPRESPLAALKSISWSQLLNHDLITLQRPSSLRRQLEEALAANAIEFRVALECHQLATVSQLVIAGLGVSVVPSLLQPQLSAMGACCLRLRRPTIHKRVGIITRQDEHPSAAAQALKALMSETPRP